ncbi:hypothetical protein NKH77_41850 [Streptomyces sp. M19]
MENTRTLPVSSVVVVRGPGPGVAGGRRRQGEGGEQRGGRHGGEPGAADRRGRGAGAWAVLLLGAGRGAPGPAVVSGYGRRRR